ncbi:nucleoside hydrolase [Morganella morganii]|uniref:nucleoside hydrolase n=1 Tax=Morganella morganii TaxID=582 RepID=UPI003EBDC476
MTKIIMDCDPGVDDAVAILLALASSEIELLGVTTVAGNVELDKVHENARRILALASRPDIPLARGCGRPLLARRGWNYRNPLTVIQKNTRWILLLIP